MKVILAKGKAKRKTPDRRGVHASLSATGFVLQDSGDYVNLRQNNSEGMIKKTIIKLFTRVVEIA